MPFWRRGAISVSHLASVRLGPCTPKLEKWEAWIRLLLGLREAVPTPGALVMGTRVSLAKHEGSGEGILDVVSAAAPSEGADC